MKIIISLIFILTTSPAYATIYKCIKNGNTSYQRTQCKQTTSDFILKKDISVERQEAALQKLTETPPSVSVEELDQKGGKDNSVPDKKNTVPYDDRDELLRIREAKANKAKEDR